MGSRTKALLSDVGKAQPAALGHRATLVSESEKLVVMLQVSGPLASGAKMSVATNGNSVEKWEMHTEASGDAEHEIQTSPTKLHGTEMKANVLLCSLLAQADSGEVTIGLRQGTRQVNCEPPIVFHPVAIPACRSNKARRLPTIHIELV